MNYDIFRDRIDFALHEYRSLRWSPNEVRVNRIEGWLRNTVVPIVEDLTTDIRFRQHALWPVMQLQPGAGTPERRLIEAIDEKIVALARLLVPMVDSPGSADTQVRRFVADVAVRPWFDFVEPSDYFHPYRGLHLYEPAKYPHHRDNAMEEWNIPLLSDYITRLANGRIDYWLGRIHRLAHLAVTRLKTGAFEEKRRVFKLTGELTQLNNEFIQKCVRGRLGHLSEQCIRLMLVFVAYHPAPEVPWFGQSCLQLQEYGKMLRPKINRQISHLTVIDEVATALEGCKAAFHDAPDNGDVARAATYHFQLVVDAGTRELYWKGKPVQAVFTDGQWEFLCELVKLYSSRGASLCWDDMPRSTTQNAFKTMKRAVTKALTSANSELATLICRGQEQASYSLNIDRGDIYFIQSVERRTEIWELVSDDF